MGLSQVAAERAAAERNEATRYVKEEREKKRAEMIEKLMRTWDSKPSEIATEGYEVSWIDTRTFEYPKRYRDRYGSETVRMTQTTVYRFRVDDVTVWATDDYREGVKFTPEVTCEECGREVGASFCESVHGAYGCCGNGLVRAIQRCAGRTFRCPFCTTQTPRECPTCGRANF